MRFLTCLDLTGGPRQKTSSAPSKSPFWPSVLQFLSTQASLQCPNPQLFSNPGGDQSEPPGAADEVGAKISVIQINHILMQYIKKIKMNAKKKKVHDEQNVTILSKEKNRWPG